MKPKFELGQKAWFLTPADTFMCWKPEEDTIVKIEMLNDAIYYTTSHYDSIQIRENNLYANEEDCKRACITKMQDNIKHIQEHIDNLMK